MTQSEKKVFIKMKRLYSHENLEYKSVKVIFYILKIRENKILYNKEENEYLKRLYLKKIIKQYNEKKKNKKKKKL